MELALGAIGAVGELGPQAALTGPALRGDSQTLQAHLDILGDEPKRAYQQLTGRLLKLAEKRGLETERIKEIETLLG